jgi:hypothetical protein
MITSIPIEPRTEINGAGIYEAGSFSSLKLFVTDFGKVLPINHRVITEDDLLTVYKRGWEDALGNQLESE